MDKETVASMVFLFIGLSFFILCMYITHTFHKEDHERRLQWMYLFGTDLPRRQPKPPRPTKK